MRRFFASSAAVVAALVLVPAALAQDAGSDGDGVSTETSAEQSDATLTPSCGGWGTEPALATRLAARTATTSDSTVTCSDGSAASCKSRKVWVALKNVHGSVLWRYYVGVEWCYRRGLVTSVRYTRWPQITGWGEFYGWQFAGHVAWSAYPNYIQPGHTYSPRTSYSRAHSVGKFRRCVTFGASYCWGERYGRLDVVVYGNGAIAYDGSA